MLYNYKVINIIAVELILWFLRILINIVLHIKTSGSIIELNFWPFIQQL
jgi:hypothetical protein